MAIVEIWNSNQFGTGIVGTLHDIGELELVDAPATIRLNWGGES